MWNKTAWGKQRTQDNSTVCGKNSNLVLLLTTIVFDLSCKTDNGLLISFISWFSQKA